MVVFLFIFVADKKPKNMEKAVDFLKRNLPSLFVDDSGHYANMFEIAKAIEKVQDLHVNEFGMEFPVPLMYWPFWANFGYVKKSGAVMFSADKPIFIKESINDWFLGDHNLFIRWGTYDLANSDIEKLIWEKN